MNRRELRWDDYEGETCSVFRTVELLQDRWTMLVLREVFNGVRRFDDIRQHIGVSRSVLADRLSRLVEAGVLERRPYQEPGDRRRHEYRLTEMGRGMQVLLVALMDFGDRWLAGPDGPPVLLRHRDCGAPVAPKLMCDEGHEVRGRELELQPGPGARLRRPA